MTRIQKMTLDYHFKVEQEAGSSMFAFFGFNGITGKSLSQNLILCNSVGLTYLTSGTAGVWRISSIKEAGGWEDRTTVEDMDLAVRVGLKGWKFIYVGDVKVSLFLRGFVKVSYSTNVVIGFNSLVKLNLFIYNSTLEYT